MNGSAERMDNTIRIVTPENIAFEYRLAGPFRRAVAYVIDFFIRAIILTAIFFLAFWFLRSEASVGVLLIAYFLLDWGYGGVFETFANGQTPGKKLTSVRVVSTDGLPINGQQAILRNILRVVDCFWYFLVGGISFLISKRFQRLGDVASDTMVVLEEGHAVSKQLPIPEIPEEIEELIPAVFPIDETLAEALGAYVTRRSAFSHGRRAQLAGVLVESLRTRFPLPEKLDDDLLVCSLYRRIYL